jgi:hypothetical protein
MTQQSTNNKISALVASQLPAFVRDDSPLFVSFMEAYYEYLEKTVDGDTGSTGTGRAIERLKSLTDARSVEKTLQDFTSQLYSEFLHLLPETPFDNSNTTIGSIVGTNYLTYSDGLQFVSGTGWANGGLTWIANSETWTDGTQTATKVLEQSSTGAHFFTKTVLRKPANGPLTLSFNWKPFGRTAFLIQLKDNIAGLDGPALFLNLSSNGVLTRAQHNLGTGTVVSNTYTALSNGWYNITLTGNTTAANGNLLIATYLLNGHGYGGVSYTGNTELGASFKNFQLEPGFTATEYASTGNLVANSLTGIYEPRYVYSYPRSFVSDYRKLLPKIKDFYRARGTEKSYKFLLRLLSNGKDTELFYPKKHIFKSSDGKWFVQRSLRVSNTHINGVADNSSSTLALYAGRQLRGLLSNTTATVERTEQFYELGTLINEIFLSGISNTFTSGETVQASYVDDLSGSTVTINSDIFSGLVTSVVVNNGGTGYTIGTPVSFVGGEGTGAAGVVSSVTTGNIATLSVINGGSGYKVNDPLLFTGGGGTGAAGQVLSVNSSGAFHPNTYNIDSNQISEIQSATWGAAQTIFARTTANLALNVISSLASAFTFSDCGPVVITDVTDPGTGYTSLPTVSVVGNTTMASLGILGSLIINNGGANYAVGEELIFTNPPDGYGFGAKANVFSVNGTGSITGVRYHASATSEIPGGMGYFTGFLPTITISTASGVGANITVRSPVAAGATITPTTGAIGTITGIDVTSGGQGYTSAPEVVIPGGDGEAEAVSSVVQGVFTYPGYFLNQDGFPSSFNFLQNRDYWQNYSYVVRVAYAYKDWIQSVKDLLHPSGMRVFGDYMILDDSKTESNSVIANDSVYVAQQYTLPNATFFDGSSYFKAQNGGYWFGVESSWHLTSLWFKMNTYIQNVNTEMTLLDHAYANGAQSAYKVVIKKAPYIIGQNYVPYSNQLNNSPTWVNAALVITANDMCNPAVSNTVPSMELCVPNGTNGQHYLRHYFVYGDRIPTGGRIIFSVYAKAKEYYKFYLRLLDTTHTFIGAAKYFDLSNYPTSNIYLTSAVDTQVQGLTANCHPVGNGVFRCSITMAPLPNTTQAICDIIMLSNSGSEVFTGDSVGGMWFGDAQIEPVGRANDHNASVYTQTVTSIPQLTLGNPDEDPSGTGHYIEFSFANNTGYRILTVKSDELRHPLQTNIWYHAITCLNVKAGAADNQLFLNNVNSTITVTRTANVNQNIDHQGTSVTSVGANTATVGGNLFHGYMSQIWTGWFASPYPMETWANRNDWLAPPLLHNSNLTANGYGWQFNAQPQLFFTSNTVFGNTNASRPDVGIYRMFGNTVGLLPGPGHPNVI